MTLRSAITRSLEASAVKASNVVPFPKSRARQEQRAKKPRGERRRKQPPKGKHYERTNIYRGVAGFQDDLHRFTKITMGDKVYMRRDDGVWFKPMRTGEWTSLLSPPKGGEAAFRRRRAAQLVGAGGAAAAGKIAYDDATDDD